MKLFFSVYKKIISPLIHGLSVSLSGNPFLGCKFEPSCSCYCEQAIQKYGVWVGLFKGVTRLLKCHPFSRSGGHDPV